eukprot:4930004-Prorocentrum_lima.AAC.1
MSASCRLNSLAPVFSPMLDSNMAKTFAAPSELQPPRAAPMALAVGNEHVDAGLALGGGGNRPEKP